MASLLVVNGPNLNLLGKREPAMYGNTSLSEIEKLLLEKAKKENHNCSFFQSNHEGRIIDSIHAAIGVVDGLIINPGGLTHTSISLRDAIACLPCPKVEVHISNIFSREPFRSHSYLSEVMDCVLCGAGVYGYEMALDYLITRI